MPLTVAQPAALPQSASTAPFEYTHLPPLRELSQLHTAESAQSLSCKQPLLQGKYAVARSQ
jgi:hypothetical protein